MKTYAIKMSADQMKADSGKDYNPSIWEENIDRYLKYRDVEFYKVGRSKLYDYDRYFVVYTLKSGLRLMNSFSYHTSISNSGFMAVVITDIEFDAETNQVKHLPENTVLMYNHLFHANGKEVALNNSQAAVDWMAERSKKYGCIYTKESI